MQADTRDALSCMDRYQPTGPHGHVSGGGYDLFDPIGYLVKKES